METSKPLTKRQMNAWKKHVLKCYPEEACAYIVDGKIFPVKNISEEPTKRFAVSALDRFEAEKGVITGFLHSHPADPVEAAKNFYPMEWPSGADMKGWFADNTRWGISGTDGEEVMEPIWLDNSHVAALIGRPFIHGIWDCYATIRDYYRLEKGIELMNFARGMEWWNKGEDLYSENFEKAGFVEIPPEEVLPGDVMLMTISGDTICHAAIVIDSSRMLHHTWSRNGQGLSCYADLGKWSKHVAKYIRYSPKA